MSVDLEKYQSESLLSFVQKISLLGNSELIDFLKAEIKEIAGANLVAYFSLNQSTFDFELTGLYSFDEKKDALSIYDDLFETNCITETLQKRELVEKEYSSSENVLIIPIIESGVLYSILIICFERIKRISQSQLEIVNALLTLFTLKCFSSKTNHIGGSKENRNTLLFNQIENLKQGTEDLHKIIDSIQEGIFVVDQHSKQIYDVNKTASDMIGISRDGLIGKQQAKFFLFNKVFNPHKTNANEEALLIHSVGKQIPILYRTAEIILGDYDYEIISFVDITERKIMEEKIQRANSELEILVEERTKELRETNKELQREIVEKEKAQEQLVVEKQKAEKAERAKSTLLANMSHEFRTPLISILGFSDLLNSELKDDTYLNMTKAIQSGGKRLLNTLDSVLTLSHLESSNTNLKLKQADIIPLIKDCVENYKLDAEKKSLPIKFETTLQEYFVETEERYLAQTLNHLIDNAIKYTQAGEIKVLLNTYNHKGVEYVLISVQDTGIGIAKEDQQTIFDAFRQASEGYCRNYEGVGLGLTIAQKIMHLMNGKISVKSVLNVGSRFTIWLLANK